MGYTHYWTQTRDFTPQEMNKINGELLDIVKVSGIPLGGWDGTGSPEFTTETIGFNGKGDDDGHETFRINATRKLPFEGASPDRLGWAFCKTAAKPYDIVVVACLTVLAAKHGFDVSSDGGAKDWEDGVKLASKALGEIFTNPMRREEAA